MIPTYASHRKQPPSNKFTVSSYPGTASSIKRYVYIQFQNRAGRSLLSEPKVVTSRGIRVILNDGLILDSEEVFWVNIAVSVTGAPEDAKLLSSHPTRFNNQLTSRKFPAVIYLTTEEHFKADRSFNSSADLKIGNYLPGAIALVLDTNTYYRYDPEAYVDEARYWRSYGSIVQGSNKWIVSSGGFNAYQFSTTELNGSDLRLDTVTSSLKIPPKVGKAGSTAQRYWLNNGLANDGGSPIISGRYSLDISVNGVSGYSSVFANKFEYYLRGYLNRDTLELDTDIDTVNERQIWNPTDGYIVLPEELPRNYAAVYDLVLTGSNDDFIGVLPSAVPEIQVDFIEVEGTASRLSEVANVIGDLAFSDRGKLLIVPGLKRLPGIGSIKLPNSSQGYLIDTVKEQLITGLLPNIPNQVAAIAGSLNGLITIKQEGEELEVGEKARAYISTESGLSNLAVASTALTVDNAGIEVTIEHPVTDEGLGIVRKNYSDRYLAGNDRGEFTPTAGYIFLDIDGAFYQSEELSITALESQDFFFSNLDSFTSISNLPVQSDPAFSLFEPKAIEVSNTSSGSISGEVTAYSAYYYDEENINATKICHDLEVVIPTTTFTIGEVVSRLSEFADHINNRDNPHQITRAQIEAASEDEFKQHEGSRDNPHQITAAQINALTLTEFNDLINSLGTACIVDTGTSSGQIAVLESNDDGRGVLPAIPRKRIVENNNFIATPNVLISVDTSNREVTATIPETIAINDWFWFTDASGSNKDNPTGFGSNKFRIDPGTIKVQGYAETVDVDSENSVVLLQFDGIDNLNVIGGNA